jgi:hypothetical protein
MSARPWQSISGTAAFCSPMEVVCYRLAPALTPEPEAADNVIRLADSRPPERRESSRGD